MTTRNRIYQQTFIHAYQGDGISPLNRVVFFLVISGAAVAILSTEPTLSTPYGSWFRALEVSIASFFLLEYLVRLWCVGEAAQYAGLLGRIRYMLTPMAIVDLLSFLPCLLTLGVNDSLILRLARLMRFIRFLKLGQYSRSIQMLFSTIKSCWRELIVSFYLAMLLIALSATCLYFLESDIQPEAFGSIPRALWWAMATLTTIGYGDVYPVTLMGKILTGIIAITGIGLVGLPTAILAGAFSDAYKARRSDDVS